jgi:hypothetical protein
VIAASAELWSDLSQPLPPEVQSHPFGKLR